MLGQLGIRNAEFEILAFLNLMPVRTGLTVAGLVERQARLGAGQLLPMDEISEETVKAEVAVNTRQDLGR